MTFLVILHKVFYKLQPWNCDLFLPLLMSLFPWLFPLTLPESLFSRRILFSAHHSYLPSAHRPPLLMSSFTPSFPISCLHHHTLLKVILDPPGLLIFLPCDGFSHLPYPSSDCPGSKHLWFLIIIQKGARRHSTLHILADDGLIAL